MPHSRLAGFWVAVASLGSRWLPNAATASLVLNPGIVNRAVHAFRDAAAVAACRVAAEDSFYYLTTGTAGGVWERRRQRPLKKMCKEGAYWGTAAGVYVATESVAEDMRGCTDWKNTVIGGAFAGAFMSAVAPGRGSKLVKGAIAGAAIAVAADLIGRRRRVHLLPGDTVVSSSQGGTNG